MADITWINVVDHAKKLADPAVDTDAQADILADANATFKVTEFPGGESGAKLKLARIYYAAHFGTTIQEGGGGAAAGTVVAETAGGLSRSYASAASIASSSGFDQTPYGRLLLTLIRSLPSRAAATL